MPRRNYVPTETDRLTGERLRELRKRRGETLAQTAERSGFGRDRSTLAATERGERLLTEIEATKLAAHFNTTADKIITHPKRPALLPVSDFDGNMKASGGVLPAFDPPEDSVAVQLSPALFAVPEASPLHKFAAVGFGGVDLTANVVTIDRNAPMTPEQYRAQVWIPYLENRYANEQKAS